MVSLLQEGQYHNQRKGGLDGRHAEADERAGKARGPDIPEMGGQADAGKAQQEAPVHEVSGHPGFGLAQKTEGVQQDDGNEAEDKDRELVDDDPHLAGIGQLGLHPGILGRHHDGQHQHDERQADDAPDIVDARHDARVIAEGKARGQYLR